MRLSRYFLPILRETPKEAEIVSHRLMLRAGMIRQEAAGIYAWLPLGLKVLNKVNAIVREEQNRSGAVELLMPTIQSADLWRESGRYDAYGKEMLRIQDRHEREMLFGPTNEEMVTEIFRGYVRSYKDLPLNLYHIQWKFRDEVRPRFGVMRSREFLMKDAYSFDLDQAGAVPFLQQDVRGLSAHLRPHGPEGDPDARGYRPHRRKPEPRIHHPGLDRRERGVLPRGLSEFRHSRGRTRISTTFPASRAPSTSGRRSTPRPPRCTMPMLSRPFPPTRRCRRGASRSATSSISAPSIPTPMGAKVMGPDGQERRGPYGLLRHRPEPPDRRHHRGEP